MCQFVDTIEIAPYSKHTHLLRLMAEPGFYKPNYRALTIREMVRARGLLKLPMTFILTRFVMKAKGGTWMPGVSTETDCRVDELPSELFAKTEPLRKSIESLGFVPCFYSKLRRNLNPTLLDNGSVTYLHSGGSHIAVIVFGRVKAGPPLNTIREFIYVGFTAVVDNKVESFCNSKNRFDLDIEGRSTFVDSNDVSVIYQQFIECVGGRQSATRVFAGCEEMRQWYDETRVKKFEKQVKRGLFVRMTDAEVEQARLRMER